MPYMFTPMLTPMLTLMPSLKYLRDSLSSKWNGAYHIHESVAFLREVFLKNMHIFQTCMHVSLPCMHVLFADMEQLHWAGHGRFRSAAAAVSIPTCPQACDCMYDIHVYTCIEYIKLFMLIYIHTYIYISVLVTYMYMRICVGNDKFRWSIQQYWHIDKYVYIHTDMAWLCARSVASSSATPLPTSCQQTECVSASVWPRTHKHTHAQMHMHMYAHIYIHICKHKCMNTHIHT